MANRNFNEEQTTPLANKQKPGASEFKRGFTLGRNGYMENCGDIVATKIPQIHALLTVLRDEDWAWNDEIKQQLINLACGLADEIHEAHAESTHKQFARCQH